MLSPSNSPSHGWSQRQATSVAILHNSKRERASSESIILWFISVQNPIRQKMCDAILRATGDGPCGRFHFSLKWSDSMWILHSSGHSKFMSTLHPFNTHFSEKDAQRFLATLYECVTAESSSPDDSTNVRISEYITHTCIESSMKPRSAHKQLTMSHSFHKIRKEKVWAGGGTFIKTILNDLCLEAGKKDIRWWGILIQNYFDMTYEMRTQGW